MSELSQKDKWWAGMIRQHGSEEAVREFMREARKMSKGNTGGGGFAHMKQTDPERLRELGRKVGKLPKRGNHGHNTSEQES